MIGFNWDRIQEGYIPLIIFGLRSFDLALATLRMLLVVAGRRSLAWIFGFLQSATFVLGIAGVLGNLSNPLNLLAYAAGFGFGNLIGITLEGRLAPGQSLIKIVSPQWGAHLSDSLRELGHGVTEVLGHGINGTVSVLYCYVPRREIQSTKGEILALDPDAFITVQSVRQIQGGWWR